MTRITLISLVPVLRNFDRWQPYRRPERGQIQLVGKYARQIRRYRRDTVRSGSNDCSGNEAREPKQDIFRGNFGFKGMLRDLMHAMPGI